MQMLLVFLIAVGALAWLVRGALKGSCASGCDGCGKACPAQRLQAVAARAPRGRRH